MADDTATYEMDKEPHHGTTYRHTLTVAMPLIRRAVPCAEPSCPDYQRNREGVPQSRFCWEHAKQHGEVSHG